VLWLVTFLFEIVPVRPCTTARPAAGAADGERPASPVTHTRSTPLVTALASILVVATLLSASSTAPGAPVPAAADPQVVIGTGQAPTTAGGGLDVSVAVTVARAATGMTVRMRLVSPTGAVVLDMTSKRGRLEPSTYLLGFTSTIPAGRLREGRHRVDVEVRVAGGRAVVASQTLYVVGATRAPLPVCVVVRVPGIPAPASSPTSTATADAASVRSETAALAQLAAARPDLRLAAVVPAVLPDTWRAAGEMPALEPTSASSGAPDSTDAATHRATIESLARAVAGGGLSLLSAGYADPDVVGLSRIGATRDLIDQFALGSEVTSDVLGAGPSTGTVVWGGPVPATAFSSLASAHVGFAIVTPAALVPSGGSAEATAGPGVWSVGGTDVRGLVADERLSYFLSDVLAAHDGALDHLFGQLVAQKGSGTPLVAVVDVGPGSRTTVRDLERALAVLSRSGWIRFTDVRDAASATPSGEATLRASDETAPAQDSRWGRVAAARGPTMALLAAAGPEDADAAACLRSLYLAEARIWSGEREDRGAAYAADAAARAKGVLGAVTLAVPNVTLSGSGGSVPVSINNATGRTLKLVLRVTPTRVRLTRGSLYPVEAPAGESIVAVPVEMGASATGALGLELLAGESTIASGTSALSAGFFDRLAVAGGVVLVLLVLLWYIRRRGRVALDRARDGRDAPPEARSAGAADDRRTP
jgi:hypothetical protein